MQYRTAKRGELPDGCTVEIRTGVNSALVLLSPQEVGNRLPLELTAHSSHQAAHGSWRRTGPEAPTGYPLSVTRLERTPSDMLPSGRTAVAIEEAGSCIWLVDELECTQRLQNDMNDTLYELTRQGIWIQTWFTCRRQPPEVAPAPGLNPQAPLLLP
ncbi:MAG TPA: hypothetical protein VFP69_11720 [Streptomyces sp.]|nr:hypothetical protein [Streptomyces sp.]